MDREMLKKLAVASATLVCEALDAHESGISEFPCEVHVDAAITGPMSAVLFQKALSNKGIRDALLKEDGPTDAKEE